MGKGAWSAIVVATLLATACVGAATPVPTATPLRPRPVAVTPCEKAYAALAYRWDDREADPTTEPGGDGLGEPDLYRLAVFEFCSFDDLRAAADTYLVHRYRGYQGWLVPFWAPSRYQLEVVDCADGLARETNLCREIRGDIPG